MFVVATLAAIIASQALISAVFQIVSQAIVQGFFPRFHVYHTSREVSSPLRELDHEMTVLPFCRSRGSLLHITAVYAVVGCCRVTWRSSAYQRSEENIE